MSFYFFMPSGSGSGGGGGGNSSNVQYIIPMGDRIPAEPVFLTAGDEAGKLTYQLRDTLTGAPIVVAEDASVTFLLREVGAVTADINTTGAVEWGAQGWVSFTFDATDPVPAAGRYHAVFVVDGLSFPVVTHGGAIPVVVAEALA